jgi:hypothetical protein
MARQERKVLGLAKIGSIVVHADEAASTSGHAFDVAALRALLADPEVVAWLEAMRATSLLPLRRTP